MDSLTDHQLLLDYAENRSEAAFARAFKRVAGVSPGSVKKQAGEIDPAIAQFLPA